MKLYLIERKDKGSFDEAHGFLVAAKNSGRARTLASRKSHDEGPAIWLTPSKSTSVCVGTTTARVSKEGVLLKDVLEG